MSVIGIDIGFQSCTIAAPRTGGIEVLLNEYSKRQSPAYVSLCDKNRELGESGKQKAVTNFKNTLSNFKHLIGRDFKDEEVQKELASTVAKTEEMEDGSVGFRVQYCGETRVFSVTQVVGMLLTKMRMIAEKELGNKVTDCCVGVPAYFNDRQRHALVHAAKLAGIEVKLFNEPTAVALAYGIYKQDLPVQDEGVKPKKVIFVDVGHSQTQMCAVDYYKGKLEVQSMVADRVGGRDFDGILFDHFCAEFKEKKKIDVKSNPRASIRLMTECEKLKKLMSANSTPVPMNVECLMNDIDVSGKLARKDFEEMAAEPFSRIEGLAKALLEQLKANGSIKDVAEIDSLQIVGGATRIPKIKSILTEVFGQETKTELNTDEAVSRGCALRAAIYSPTLRVRDFAISDKTMHGIKLSWKPNTDDGSGVKEVFAADSALKKVLVLTFERSEDFNLTAEYSDPSTANQSLIGTFRINGVVPNFEGKHNKIKSKIKFDENGCFIVDETNMIEKLPPQKEEEPVPMETDKKPDAKKDDDAKEDTKDDKKADAKKTEAPAKKKQKTSRTVPLKVIADKPHVLSADQQNKLLEVELAMQSQDRSEREKSDAKNALEEYIYAMRDKLSMQYEKYILEEEKEKFSATLTKYEDWLYDEGEDVTKSEYNAKLNDLKEIGDKVERRFREAELRPAAIEKFQKAIVQCRKFVEQKTAGDDKYAHITEDEMKKVTDAYATHDKYLLETTTTLSALAKHLDPPVTAKDIESKCSEFVNIFSPILTKPAPKVEPPKDDKPATEEGTKDTPAADEKPTEGKPTETKAEDAKDDAMDID